MLNGCLSIKIYVDWATLCDSLIALCFCMLHSVVYNSGLSSLEFKNFFFNSKLFSRGGSIPTLHLKTFNILFSGPDLWKIYRSVKLTALMWHDGVQRTGTFLLSLSLRKMCLKLLTLSCTYEFIWQCSIGN